MEQKGKGVQENWQSEAFASSQTLSRRSHGESGYPALAIRRHGMEGRSYFPEAS